MPTGSADRSADARSSPDPAPADLRTVEWLDGVREIEPGSVDLVYADPPFNTGQRRAGRTGAYEDRWESMGAWLGWLEARLRATIPLLRRSGSLLLHLDWRTSHRARCLLDDLLGPDRFVNHLVWSYGLGGSSARRFARKHDDILFYCLDPGAYWFEPPRIPATSRRMAGMLKKATDVLEIPAINNMAAERTGYPDQKPLALLDVLVRACCPPGGVVLDPCCGSGTAVAAAVAAGRRGIGLDVSPGAIAVARSRVGHRRLSGVAGVVPGGMASGVV